MRTTPAAAVAVRECLTKATEPCSLYAVDAEVVWAPDGKGAIYAGSGK